ncbi:MAG: SGNH/GDSL hydrolase family protein [Clostridium sp.]|nr:SGNH/GDSL hydrolase family protein [Clostridium sp.]
MTRKRFVRIFLAVLVIAGSLAALTRLLVPKYMGQVTEGAFIGEYYDDKTPHDLLILGDCEAYENISPVALWKGFGITSWIRGSAQQLIPQSYFLLEDTLRHEKPKAVLLSISAMQQIDQVSETYNRMTLDGMKWSKVKLSAIEATKMPEEHLVEYIFPLLRFHSRWSDLGEDDFRYYLHRNLTTHNGYYLRADVRPAGEFPEERRVRNPEFDEKGYEYLDRIRELCDKEGIELLFFKAPSLYPVWHREWNMQIEEYAEKYGIPYINALEDIDRIGIDLNTDTYDGGLHMNVYGAEKISAYLGPVLQEAGLPDHRGEAALDAAWTEKEDRYEAVKAAQEQEFAEKGFLAQFAGEDEAS